MTKRKSAIDVSIELGWTVEQTARALGLSPTKFAELRPSLESWGFPRPHPLLDRYVVDQVRRWCNRPLRGGAEPAAVTNASGPAPKPAPRLAPVQTGTVSQLIAERVKSGSG